jgi:hypothetical protein
MAVHAAVRVYRLRWTCDDAFISYRYAKHLVDGHGLVFNAGERVEGYTNFLFTLLVAGAMRLGADPRHASMALGAAAYFGVAALLCRAAYRRPSDAGLVLPLGAAMWLAQDDLQTWATGGLETTVFTWLAFGGVHCITVAADEDRERSAVLGGGLLSLACLTRPDGALFAAVGLVAPLVRARTTLRAGLTCAALVAAPLVVVGGAFLGFKLVYYGRLLPTAFYAKSAFDPYYSQGLTYVALYLAKHWAFGLGLVGLPLAAILTGRLRALLARREAIIAAGSGLLFAAYVAHSGGDYMFARRLVPALPFLFVFLDAVVAVLRPIPALLGAPAIALGSLFPNQVFDDGRPQYVHGITDERAHYPEAVIDARRRQAELARDVFGRLAVPASFGGGMCMFAYYSDLPDLVEPNGLTAYWIAERRLAQRGTRVGHEKATTFDALREHGVKLIFHRDLPPLPRMPPRFDELTIDDQLRVQLLVYDDAVVDALARDPRVRFRHIDDVLLEATDDLARMTCDDARTALESLTHYYLDRHPDRATPLQRAVDAACAR